MAQGGASRQRADRGTRLGGCLPHREPEARHLNRPLRNAKSRVTAERTTRKINKGHLSDKFSLSACRCKGRASNTFLLQLGSSSSICHGYYSLVQYNNRVHQLGMKRGHSKGTCITYQQQMSCLQATLPLSTARAGPTTLTRHDDTFTS